MDRRNGAVGVKSGKLVESQRFGLIRGEQAMSDPAAEQDGTEGLDQLLVQAREGSASARNELFRQVQRYLTWLAQQHHNPQLSAKAGTSDIVQQTLLQAAGEFDRFRGTSAEEFRGWLRQILLNEARGLNRHYGAQRRSARAELPLSPADSTEAPGNPADDQLTPCSDAMAREQAAWIRQCMEKLPEEMHQVIRLRNWERLQFHEIGERMGMATSSAAKLWYRALIELQRLHSEGQG